MLDYTGSVITIFKPKSQNEFATIYNMVQYNMIKPMVSTMKHGPNLNSKKNGLFGGRIMSISDKIQLYHFPPSGVAFTNNTNKQITSIVLCGV